MKVKKDWTTDDCQIPPHLSWQPRMVWIYGLFDKIGICLYVGLTTDFRKRFNNHKFSAKSRVLRERFVMLPLTLVPELLGRESEIKFQKAYESIGQANRSMLIPNHLRRKWKQNNYSLDGILR